MSTAKLRTTTAACFAALALTSACKESDPAPPSFTYTIAGRVTGASTAGVTVSLSGGATRVTTTDADGAYTFSGVGNGGYVVSAAKGGFALEPATLPVTVAGASRTGNDFVAYPLVYAISGGVTGVTQAGVTITATGPATASATTGIDGLYVVTVAARGDYTLAASQNAFGFAPLSRAVTLTFWDVTGQDFVASSAGPLHKISGTVGGATAAGVKLTLTGATSAAVFSDPDGVYTFAGLPDGSYTVTPSKAGYRFTPPVASVTVSGADAGGNDFTAAQPLVISGAVTGIGAAGVTMTLSGDASATTLTDPAGVYTFADVANGSYRVAPSKTGLMFVPAFREVTVAAAPGTLGVDFGALDLEWASWPLPAAAPGAGGYAVDAANGTVSDHATGLVWQRASEGNPLADCSAGPATGCYTWAEAKAHCAALTLSGLGAGAWRLPALIELASLADYGTYQPAIEVTAFPSTPSEYHWSSTPDASFGGYAWAVTFRNGESVVGPTTNRARARCVRSTPVPLPPGTVAHYTVGAETVTDQLTGLVWQRAVIATSVSWANAQSYCATLSLGGLASGWRLPNMKELQSLIDVRASGPAIDAAAFPSTPVDRYWSSTRDASLPAYSWAIDFASGDTLIGVATNTASVRCVR